MSAFNPFSSTKPLETFPRKKPFLLIEVLLAIAICTLCLVPLLQPSLSLLKKEKASLLALRASRQSDLAFWEVKEQLLTHTLSWKDLPGPEQTKGPFPLQNGTYTLYCPPSKEKMGTKKELYRLLTVRILLSDYPQKPATYHLFVTKNGPAQDSPPSEGKEAQESKEAIPDPGAIAP